MIEVLFAEMAKIKDRLDILETAAKEQEKAGECRHDWQVDYMGYSFCTNGCGATKPKPEPTPTVEVKEKSKRVARKK